MKTELLTISGRTVIITRENGKFVARGLSGVIFAKEKTLRDVKARTDQQQSMKGKKIKTILLVCVLSIVAMSETIVLQPKKVDLSRAIAAMNTVKIDMSKAIVKATTIMPVVVK
jgi:hypothetical protein